MASPVSGSAPNLINGISQQAPALRLATQGEYQNNFYSTIVEGLKDRPPTEFVAKLLDTLPDGVFTHVINRDVNERYIVVLDPTTGHIRVWDFNGTEKTVTAPNGWDYLADIVSPVADVKALTIADYTFITNTKKVVEMGTTTSPVRNPEALVNVLAGNYGKTYGITIKVGATTYSYSYTTTTTDATGIDTVVIASALASGLSGAGVNSGNGFTVTQYSNALHIQRTDTTDFTITVVDGYNGNAMKAVKDRTQHFSDLPNFGPDGFAVEIIGEAENVFDNYWVKSDASTSGPIVWKETLKGGIKLSMDPTTMPHTLVREADGTFVFDQATWDPRKCGDEDISPEPSFVGGTINKIFFHRNRLGCLSGENAVMSRNGSFFDFFRTSATTVLDDDPIDVADTHVKVSILNHALPYQDLLILFSDQTQFTISGNDQLTPKTVTIHPRTEFVTDPHVSPIGLGSSAFFASTRGDYSAIWEWTIDRVTQVANAKENTEQAPAYVPAGLYKLFGNSNENFLGALTTGDPEAIYVFKYYTNDNGDRLQAAWQRWSFEGVTILNAEFVESTLYVLGRTDDGVFLWKMRVHPNVVDSGIGFVVHLDQRVHTSQISAGTYNSSDNTTSFTLPYTVGDGIIAVTAPGADGPIPREVPVVSHTGTTVKLKGDVHTWPMWFGYNYERRYRFSRFFLRKPSAGGGTQTVQSGRLQLKNLTLSYDKSASFRVEVTPEGRSPYTYKFAGRIVGASNNILGTVMPISGKKTIPILSRNDRVTIDIVNDTWMPSSFISAEWTGTHTENARDF